MSHVYVAEKDGKRKEVQLSNTTHELLQDELGWDRRQFVHTETGKRMETYFHTTIHDTGPVGVAADELYYMLNELELPACSMLNEPAQWLEELCDFANANEIEMIYIY